MDVGISALADDDDNDDDEAATVTFETHWFGKRFCKVTNPSECFTNTILYQIDLQNLWMKWASKLGMLVFKIDVILQLWSHIKKTYILVLMVVSRKSFFSANTIMCAML